MLKSKQFLAAAALAAIASGAHAEADTYFGIGAGGVKAKGHTDELFANVAAATSTDKTSSTGFKAYWGYAFRPQLAVEVQYANLGTVARRDWSPAADASANLKVSAWSASLLGRLGTPELAAFGKLGPYIAEQQQSQNGSGFGGDNKTSSTQSGWAAGIGADWRFDKAWSLRLEWERYFGVAKNLTVNQGGPNPGNTNGNGISLDFFSLSAAYHF